MSKEHKECISTMQTRVMKKTGMFVNASHEAVREWYQKGKELFEQSTEIKIRKWIAVDEKEITINGITVSFGVLLT